VQNELDGLEVRIDESKKKETLLSQRKTEKEAKLDAKRVDLEQVTEAATSVGPRVDSRRQRSQVQKEIAKQRTVLQVSLKGSYYLSSDWVGSSNMQS